MQDSCTPTRYIILTNVNDGDIHFNSVVLIKGRIKNVNSNQLPSSYENTISLQHLQEDLTVQETQWAVRNCAFKVLADLHPGANNLTLNYYGTKLCLVVSFMAKLSLLHVVPVYIICLNDDGRFQAPASQDNTVVSACRRIWVGCRLIQCLAADKIGKTFQLSHDLDPSRDRVEVFRSSLAVEEARKMPQEELWQFFGRELVTSSLGSDRSKFMAFLSCTLYKPGNHEVDTHEQVVGQTAAHVALGGGGLALLGCGCLHTWPETVADVADRFLDQTPVADTLMDDSSYRGTHGGCFATTLGAMCHELSHTFDLAHTDEGIMSRGFDNIHAVFMVNAAAICTASVRKPWSRNSSIAFNTELQVSWRSITATNSTLQDELEDDIHWAPSCNTLLNYHRWFNNDDCSLGLDGALKFLAPRKMLTSAAGIRVVEIRNDCDHVIQSWQFLHNKGRDTFLLPTGIWCQPTNTLVAEDSAGNIVKVALKTIY